MAKKGRRALESRFQSSVKHELETKYPGCIVRKNPPGQENGFPDLVMYYGPIWAMFECKREKDARKRPNQKWWVERLDEMSFARLIFPENRERVMGELDEFIRGQSRALSKGYGCPVDKLYIREGE